MKSLAHTISPWMIGAMALIALISAQGYGRYAVDLVVEHENRVNRDVAQAAGRDILAESGQLAGKLQQWVARSGVVAATIYNLEGRVMASADTTDTVAGDNAGKGFASARQGVAYSELVYQGRASFFRDAREAQEVVRSFIPLQTTPGSEPLAVMVVYSDVTALIARINQARLEIGFFGFAGFLLLAVAMRLLSRQAKQLMYKAEDSEWQLIDLDHTDEATGLPNRAEFSEKYRDMLNDRRAVGARFGMMHISLDGFEQIADDFGHEVGDEVLKRVGRRLRTSLRKADSVFRTGHDDFAVLLPGLGDKKGASIVSDKLARAISRPIRCGDMEYRVEARIGVMRPDPASLPFEQMVKNANEAMYEARKSGTHRYRVA